MTNLPGVAVCSLLATCLWSQTPPAASQAIGEVTAVNAASGQISVRTDKGASVTVVAGPNTAIRKVPPGAQNLAGAARVEFSSLGVGDRILASGQWSGDGARIEARSIVVMSRSELDEKRRLEQEDWRKRGISGTVASIDAERKTFTIAAGTRRIVVEPAAGAQFHRYAPDSVRFSDARPSVLAEIQAGDQVRLLGSRSADGAKFAAERIISGAFRQLAATIGSVNLAGGEIVIKDLTTKRNLTVRVNGDSVLRRLPPQTAASLAARYRQNGGRGGGGEDIGQTLDQLPSMQLTDLRPGDAIMLSATAGSDGGNVTAVMLLAGVEPLLTASPNATRDILSGWNLGEAAQ